MIKTPTKSQRDIPIANEECAHKKKKIRKHQKRADHKHDYITVLLQSSWKNIYGNGYTLSQTPTKICSICGRIKETDIDNRFYTQKGCLFPWHTTETELSNAAFQLPVYHVDDCFDKFAIEGPVTNK